MKNKLFSLFLSFVLVIGLMPIMSVNAYTNDAISDFQGIGFTLNTSGNYPWIVADLNGEDVLTATYGEAANPLSTLVVTFSASGVFNFDYSTATGSTLDMLLYSFEPIATSTDYSLAVNSGNKTAFSGSHDWTTVSVDVSAGDNLYFVFAKKTGGTTEGHVWLRNFSLSTGGFTVTIGANDANCGTAFASVTEVAADAEDKSVTLTATPVAGMRFYGWVENNHFLSAENPYTIEVQTNRTINAWFGTEDVYEARVDGVFYEDVLDAITAADSGISTSPVFIVLTNDATITNSIELNPYTVFVLPYSDSDTSVDLRVNTSDRPYANGIAASPASTALTQQGESVKYTLTIADGASLTVPSSSILSVGGIYSGGQPIGGQVCGAHSEIDVEGTLNVSGILSCNGYIYGDGGLNVTNGTVYENFTVTNFNGGGRFVEDATGGLFPFTTYTVMGIQCETTLDANSYLKAYCALYVSSEIMQMPVEIVGDSDALIQVSSGTAVMQYDESKSFTVRKLNGDPLAEIGTLMIKLYGNGTVGSMRLSLGSMSFNTQEFECPLPYCITIEQVSGQLDIGAKLKIMPGSQLIIDEEATLNIEQGGSLNALLDNSYFENQSNNQYTYPTMNDLMANGYFPFSEVVVAGTLTAGDGAAIGGLIMVLDGGTVEVSEYADTNLESASMNMMLNVTENELVVGSTDFMTLINTFAQAQSGDMDAYASLIARADAIECGHTYTAENGGISTSGYDEQTYIDTITFVDADYLDYVSDHGSADGYMPLAQFTQERHTALVYPNEAPSRESIPYENNYNAFPFLGWTRIVVNMLGQLQEEMDGSDVKVYETLPDVTGDTIYMAVYGDEWKYFNYTFSFEDGVDGTDIAMPDPIITNDEGYACYADITEPTRSGYSFDGWKVGDVMWQSSPSGNTYNYMYVYSVSNLADANRTVVWTAQWIKDAASEVLTLANFTNSTGTSAPATITITDSVAGTFTVSCAKACIVAVDNGDDTYTRLSASPTGDSTTYGFSCPNGFTDAIALVVVVKGDPSGDGKINAMDAAQVKSASISKLTLTGLNLLAADVNGDKKINALDAAQVKSASISKLTFVW